MDRIPIYLGLLLVALAGMETNIINVHAWNCGIEKIEPWRRRVSGALRAAVSEMGRFFAALWANHQPLIVATAVLLLALVMHPSHANAGGLAIVGALDIKELRGQREKLIVDMRGLIDKADTEKRGLNAEENEKFSKMKADALQLKATITNLEDLETEERAIVPESQRQERRTNEQQTAYEQRREALLAFAQGTVTTEHRRALLGVGEAGVFKPNPNAIVIGPTESERRMERDAMRTFERRSQNTLSLAAGGAVVAPDTSMYGRVIEALKFFGGMEAVGSEIMTTDTGADLPIATDDDTSNTGSIVAEEATQASGTSVTMGQVVLHAYLYSSKVVKVSWQLLQDASFDIEGYLGRKLGMRLGRIQNTHYTTGTGVNQPQGLATAASVGRQSATGNTSSVVADDVMRLIRSVDIAYRNQNCRFMMADATALAFELLKDGNGQYIWRNGGAGFNGLNEGSSDTLRGYRVIINNDMPALAASAKHTSFGDHSYYKIRRVRAIQLVRINELYVENGQVGFLAFMRADGGLVDAGQHPVKLLQNSAS